MVDEVNVKVTFRQQADGGCGAEGIELRRTFSAPEFSEHTDQFVLKLFTVLTGDQGSHSPDRY